MELTYTEAQGLLETTEIGYTIASQDRLWTVFIFDLWSSDEYRYNRLFTQGIGEPWSYDPWDKELFWTTRREAEAFAERMREHLAAAGGDQPTVYVMNWGDDARWEAQLIGRYGTPTRSTPKFAGSREAWDAMGEMTSKWRAGNK